MIVGGINRKKVILAMADNEWRKAREEGTSRWYMYLGDGLRAGVYDGVARFDKHDFARFRNMEDGRWARRFAEMVDHMLGDDGFLPEAAPRASATYFKDGGLSLDGGRSWLDLYLLPYERARLRRQRDRIFGSMDRGLRERLDALIAPCGDLTFIAAYIAIRPLAARQDGPCCFWVGNESGSGPAIPL